MINKFGTLLLAAVVLSSVQTVHAADNRFPYCASPDSDSDGDGYGWENDATCLVALNNTNSYTVTVRNLTYRQVFSPVMAVTHDDAVALLQAGDPASAGITAIAEGGDVSVLQHELDGVAAVNGTAVSNGPLPWGQGTSFDVQGSAGEVISIVSMLVNTNDALMVVDSLKLPSSSGESVTAFAMVYDGGTETNNEMCSEIPGPACGGAGASPGDDGEGFVHIHRGLQGVGDLNSARQAWRNPVARVTVTRN